MAVPETYFCMWECPDPLQLDTLLLSLKREAFSEKVKGDLSKKIYSMLKQVCLCLLTLLQVMPAIAQGEFPDWSPWHGLSATAGTNATLGADWH